MNINFGIGVDIENINRFAKLTIDKHNKFFNKIFTSSELAYCFSRANSTAHLAVRFAGKEALIKACYNLDIIAPPHNQIEIKNERSGKPVISWTRQGRYKAQISLSHNFEIALAFVFIYK